MNAHLHGISFNWLLLLIAVCAALFGLRALSSRRRLAREAEADWDYQIQNNMQDLRLTKDGYVNAYKRVNTPRASLYIASALGIMLVATPIILGALNGLLFLTWRLSGDSRAWEPGFLVWEFFIFFGMIGTWAFIGTMAARKYHRDAPGLMRDEIMYEKAGFRPEQPLIVGPNPAHCPIYSSDEREALSEILQDKLGLSKTDRTHEGGHEVDIYSDGSVNEIWLHNLYGLEAYPETEQMEEFYHKKHKLEGLEVKNYTVIFLRPNASDLMLSFVNAGIKLSKETGSPTSRHCSFRLRHLDIFIYEERFS